MSALARSERRLKGPSGEPVDFARTIVSHGVAELPPNKLYLDVRTLVTTLAVPGGAGTVRLTRAGDIIRIEIVSGRARRSQADAIATAIRHMFRLDEDLSGFYAVVRDDPELGWCVLSAGRMLRAPTVFEDVVKTNRTLIRNLARVRRPLPFSAPRSRRTG
jgi:3-methyladenine DNA glycosylase/8-oxoguanine DNA glycosylase